MDERINKIGEQKYRDHESDEHITTFGCCYDEVPHVLSVIYPNAKRLTMKEI